MGWQSCSTKGSFTRAILDALAEEYHFSLSVPFEEYPREIQNILINGTGGHEVKVHYKGQRGEGIYDVAVEGLVRNLWSGNVWGTGTEIIKAEYETFMRITPCPECKGKRLKPESLAVTVGDRNIYEATSMSILNLQEFLQNLRLTATQGGDRPPDFEGNPCKSGLPGGCGTGLSCRSPGERLGFQAVRHRGSAWQRRLDLVWWEWLIFWMSPALACIRGTTISC